MSFSKQCERCGEYLDLHRHRFCKECQAKMYDTGQTRSELH